MENQKAIELRAIDCFKTLEQSFNRVKYFSCIADGINVESLPKDWSIKKDSGFFYANNFQVGKEQYILDGFKHFVKCYLVRDCIESFATSLDQLAFALLINGKKTSEKLTKEEVGFLKDFYNEGLSSKKGKIQRLKERFGLELSKDSKKTVTSLKDIRNCFAHANGFVRAVDGKKVDDKNRKFQWGTLYFFAKGISSGKEYPIEIGKIISTTEETNICVQIRNHERVFQIGEQLSFSSSEAYEIGASLWRIAVECIKNLETLYLNR